MESKIRELRRRESIALVCYQEGLSLHESDLEGAERCYRQVIDVVPNHIGAMCGLASIDIDKKRVGKARKTLVAVLRISPGHEFALLELARLYSRRRKPQYLTCAAALYARALSCDLDSAKARAGLRRSISKLGLEGQGHREAITKVGLDPAQMIDLLNKMVHHFGRRDERSKWCLALRNLLAHRPRPALGGRTLTTQTSVRSLPRPGSEMAATA